MKKISTVFQTNVTNIEADIARLKKEADIAGQVAWLLVVERYQHRF
jgi:hypothetical protein